MADWLTIARPYARAAFEVARETSEQDQWLRWLGRLAELAQVSVIRDLFQSPQATPGQRIEVLVALAGQDMPRRLRNFVQTLAFNNRLDALPAISQTYEQLLAESNATVSVTVTSASTLDESHREALLHALGRRLAGQIEATWMTNPDLIGGVVIQVEDKVFDASLKTRLARLAHTVAA